MSNSSKAVQEIKKLMVQFGFMASEEQTLLSFKLEDETILETEKLELGSKIFKINEAFERVALEDGTYKLKENFELEVAEGQITSVKEIFVDAKLVDGTQIKVSGDALVEGAKVTVVTAEGEIPAPDGVHELEDGSKVETKDGIIAKIEEAVKEAEGEMPEMEGPEVEVSVPVGMEKEVMELVKEFVLKMGDKIKKMEDNMSSLSNEFESFKKEPAAKKIADGKTDFKKSNNNEDDFDAKLATIMSLRKTNK
jgi:hypothetical protein